jgi:hypothetical protein
MTTGAAKSLDALKRAKDLGSLRAKVFPGDVAEIFALCGPGFLLAPCRVLSESPDTPLVEFWKIIIRKSMSDPNELQDNAPSRG